MPYALRAVLRPHRSASSFGSGDNDCQSVRERGSRCLQGPRGAGQGDEDAALSGRRASEYQSAWATSHQRSNPQNQWTTLCERAATRVARRTGRGPLTRCLRSGRLTAAGAKLWTTILYLRTVRCMDARKTESSLQDDHIRLAMCTDLLVQLLPHCRRCQAVDPAWSCDSLLRETREVLHSGGCELTRAEFSWLESEVHRTLARRTGVAAVESAMELRREVVSAQGTC